MKRGRAIARNQLHWILNRAEANVTYSLEDNLKGNSGSEDVRFVKTWVYHYCYAMCVAYEQTVRSLGLELSEPEITTSVKHMFALTNFLGSSEAVEEFDGFLETPDWDLTDDDPVEED